MSTTPLTTTAELTIGETFFSKALSLPIPNAPEHREHVIWRSLFQI